MEIKFSTEEKDRKFVIDGLNKFNANFNKNLVPYSNKKEFGFFAYANDEIVGGISGETDMGNWVHVELLYVDEKCRGKYIGTLLIKKVEEYVTENKLVGIHLNTWDWQAKGFYEKIGFTVFGELKGHPLGGTKYYLKKQINN
jgi:ribosomal protein S18 acetylase RimI-like enzyme